MIEVIKGYARRIPGLQPAYRRARKVMGFLPVDGPRAIDHLGHRRYVTERWGEIGPLQWQFLLAHGLEPHHYLLDIACGCLQLGLHAIPYLEPGHYLGVEKERMLLDAGIEEELGRETYESRRPVLLCNDRFDFAGIGGIRPDIAWSHSLFTHLVPSSIERCLRNLRSVIAEHGVYYTTYFETTRPDGERRNARRDNAFSGGVFLRSSIERFGRNTGWAMEYIGDWGHPNGQIMVAYRPRRVMEAPALVNRRI
jgi:hypothetical protein